MTAIIPDTITGTARLFLGVVTLNGPISTREVADTTNYSVVYAGRILSELAAAGHITQTTEARDRGRPVNMWTVDTRPYSTEVNHG